MAYIKHSLYKNGVKKMQISLPNFVENVNSDPMQRRWPNSIFSI
jgi:hypothetical protein